MYTDQRKSFWKQKKFTVPLISIILLAVAFFFLKDTLFSKEKEALQTAQSFTNQLKKKDFTKLADEVTSTSLKGNDFSKKQLAEKYDNIFSGIGAHDVNISKLKVEKQDKGDGYEFTYDVTMKTSLGKLNKLSYKGVLSKEDNQWKVDWKPNLIFPQMEKRDTIKVKSDPAVRGSIVDRKGRALAETTGGNALGIIPGKLGTGKTKESHIKKISSAFDIDEEFIQNQLKQTWVTDDTFVPLKSMLEQMQIPKDVSGVTYQPKEMRYYPYNEAAAHLTGYVGKANADDIKRNPALKADQIIGKTGLEYTFDQNLRGQDGGSILIVHDETGIEETLQKTERKDGKTVKLTIDASLQKKAYQQLKGEKGAVTIMNPSSGDLLALVSTPSYDVNLMTNGVTPKQYRAYSENPDLPFQARYASRYAPGSTFKTITAAIGLETGVTKPNKVRTIHGLKWQKDQSWGNYQITRVHDKEHVNMVDALVYSDNIYFGQEALEIGKDTYEKKVKTFGFGEDLHMPFTMKPAQVSNDGIQSDILLADSAYGQGELLMSPIEQIHAYSPFATGGKLVYPRVIQDEKTASPKQIIKEDSANKVKDTLTQVVTNSNGTAHSLQIKGADIAAKTGTAELKSKQGATDGTENGFLLAFHPKKEDYILIGMIEGVKDRGGSGLVVQKMKPVIASFYE
ncbi:penicillin-binding protein [Bacillus xiamenensis]|uniref:serine-type D-Ala-D-Ala carboxypeptidase n=1 Tax=Bacillus xiamenensis TaxID=1178537 RepID=A0AAC9IIE0_9BACI|nr:penicillin-binding protein [Bacillus xiamenensis]